MRKSFLEIAEKSPDKIIENLITAADNWMDGAIQADDITFIVIKIK